jgi:hypothetical protein
MPTRRSAQRHVRQRPTGRRSKNQTRSLLFFLLMVLLILIVLLYVPPVFYVIPLLATFLIIIGTFLWRFWLRERFAQRRQQTREVASFSAIASLPKLRAEPYSLEYLLSLTPNQFEQFTGVVLEVVFHHTNIRHMGRSGDEGADLLTNDERGLPAVVQCKRWAPPGKIGSDVLQKLVGAIVHHGARSGWLVATTTLTPKAHKYLAGHYERIRLLVGPDLVEMCQRHAEELDRVWQPYFRKRI